MIGCRVARIQVDVGEMIYRADQVIGDPGNFRLYQSTDTLKAFIGSKMKPNVALVEVTALRLGLDPSTPTTGQLHRALKVPLTFATPPGHRAGSKPLPCPNARPAVPDSAMEGARKPLPQVPRIAN